MTEQQLEAAGRKLCEIRGVNPEQLVPTSSGTLQKAWRSAAAEILALNQVYRALLAEGLV